jgi:hypothetical protein
MDPSPADEAVLAGRAAVVSDPVSLRRGQTGLG